MFALAELDYLVPGCPRGGSRTGDQHMSQVSFLLMRDIMMTGRGLGLGIFSPGGARVGGHIPETKHMSQVSLFFS